jgi:alpha-glucosidase (family GH31 glycosyl hydrolase)
MFMEFPHDLIAPMMNDQYMFGDAYMVKPDSVDEPLNKDTT